MTLYLKRSPQVVWKKHSAPELPHRVRHKERGAICRQVDGILQAGIIEPYPSSWSSPVVTVQKESNILSRIV